MASFLPDSFIDYGTDLVFIAALMAAIVYVVKRIIGFLNRAKDEPSTDEDMDDGLRHQLEQEEDD